MDNEQLETIRANIMRMLTSYTERLYTTDEQIELILFSLASMCEAMKDKESV